MADWWVVQYHILFRWKKNAHTTDCVRVYASYSYVAISLWLTRWCTKIHTQRNTYPKHYTRTHGHSHTSTQRPKPNSSHCLRSQCKWQNVFTFEQRSTAKTKNTDTNTYDAIRSNTHASIAYTPFTLMWCAFYVRCRCVCEGTIWLRCCCALVVVVVAVALRVYVFCFDLILCYCMGGWLAGCSIIVFKLLCMWWISTCLLQLVPPALSRFHILVGWFCWCWIFFSVKFTVWMTNIQQYKWCCWIAIWN